MLLMLVGDVSLVAYYAITGGRSYQASSQVNESCAR
jgi:hypothetical protein